MEERYRITVVGAQTIDGERDTVEVITSGVMEITENKITVVYPEYSEDNPAKRTDTSVTLENGILCIDRQGEAASHLMLEEGVRHECLYSTPLGQMFIGIYTDSVSAELDESGGEIKAAYQLDFNGSAVSYNELYISIKEIK